MLEERNGQLFTGTRGTSQGQTRPHCPTPKAAQSSVYWDSVPWNAGPGASDSTGPLSSKVGAPINTLLHKHPEHKSKLSCRMSDSKGAFTWQKDLPCSLPPRWWDVCSQINSGSNPTLPCQMTFDRSRSISDLQILYLENGNNLFSNLMGSL